MTFPSELLYREIALSQGQTALVDDADFDWINQWKWYASWDSEAHTFYARRWDGKHTVFMHRVIMGLPFGDKRTVDHCDFNGLHNWRDNLRPATRAEQSRHQRVRKNNKVGLRGVAFRPSRGTYNATITVDGKRRYLGSFPTAELAHAAYCEAATRLHGDFARFN